MSNTISGSEQARAQRGHSRGRRRSHALAVCTSLLLATAGCNNLTGVELRSILSSSATTTSTTAFNTAFTTLIGTALQTMVQRWMNNLFGVQPILR
jgi:hypothetical protein